jgi:DNA-binding response OmpR family regulator
MGVAAVNPTKSRSISMPEIKKSILSAIVDGGVKAEVFEALEGIESYSLTWVEDSGDLLLKILDKDIDLAIIDENLAGMAGAKLIRIIKKSRPRIPLIVISSGNSKEELARVLEQGIFYFIIKPINGKELKEAVDSALKKIPRNC